MLEKTPLLISILTLASCTDNTPPPPIIRFDTLSDASTDRSSIDRHLGAPPRMVPIQPGTFLMGSPPDEPCRRGNETQHEVTLTHTFEIQSTEVTQQQYYDLLGSMPFSQCGPPCPVTDVTWYLAVVYCIALSKKESLEPCYTCTGSDQTLSCTVASSYLSGGQTIYDCPGYRLPTEAEWEYAYRANSKTAFYNGGIGSSCDADPHADAIGWYRGNSGSKLQPVGLKQPNDWDLYDMAGNAAEWVNDVYVDDLGPGKATDPTGPTSNEINSRALKGGSFEEDIVRMRAGDRRPNLEAESYSDYGFRVVRTLMTQ